MKRKRVAFATGSRADYGIVRRFLFMLNEDAGTDLGILVTGALLDQAYGYQAKRIEDDGFRTDCRVRLPLQSGSVSDVITSMSVALKEFGNYFQAHRPDLLIVPGDRYEILPVALAAAMHRIKILHIHGGEATFANYDEFIRHSITKMSMYHFTSTEAYRRRVIQLGENPDRVYNLGALGAENCLYIDLKNVAAGIRNLPKQGYFVILYHPETLLEEDQAVRIREILSAIDPYKQYKFIFIGSNADSESDIIRREIRNYADLNGNAVYYENLHTDAYHYLVKNALLLMGNSSSGIIEAPSLGTWTINIGHRQDGRVKGATIIDTPCGRDEIQRSIEYALRTPLSGAEPGNPYYQPDCAKRYYETTLHILEGIENDSVARVFYDIRF